MGALDALNPLDGRYRNQVEGLASIFSERGLMKYRIKVEGEYLISLFHSVPNLQAGSFTDDEVAYVRSLSDLTLEDAKIIKKIEREGYGDRKATNHDVKAVEYYLRDKFKGTSLENYTEWIHFSLTSEDVNNISYGLMLRDGLENFIIPTLGDIHQKLEELAQKYKDTVILARTHGQVASPTTFGKEFKVFSSRLERQVSPLKNFSILVKLNGATGNYNAHYAAFPKVDWIEFTKSFVGKFNKFNKGGIKLEPNFITTQIEPHDTYAELFDSIKRINTTLIDFDQDMWRYISDGWIVQKAVAGEVGSSTMPNKVNPIDFENSEGNGGLGNSLLEFFSEKLPISRLQRDLSDSTVERNFGTAFGYSLVGYKSILKGLSKISVDESKVVQELENHPEVIAEAIQIILRREHISGAYEKLKDLTRGRKVTMVDFFNFIQGLDIPPDIKEELSRITPMNYMGLASKIVDL